MLHITIQELHFGESKYEQDKSLIQINSMTLLPSLTVLNEQKAEGMTDKLDSMQQNLGVAERQARCLDPLIRHNSSRYQKRRGPDRHQEMQSIFVRNPIKTSKQR